MAHFLPPEHVRQVYKLEWPNSLTHIICKNVDCSELCIIKTKLLCLLATSRYLCSDHFFSIALCIEPLFFSLGALCGAHV